ncbi:hypothetical protein OG592_41035 (plasmid) [Streptomyces avidinii]|uniref:hypothetical protein n=1 Tax=Streptomyces avidinii TaxID=1895 RepID=UPI002F918DD1|nr:hypothetical protein OG592_41035 [Streptomyces avidinii]
MTRSPFPQTGSVRTRVTIDGTPDYPAVVDPANRWNGFVSPFFTLDTVRELAAETLDVATKQGYDCADTIHVIDGGTDSGGAPRAVVLHIRWMYLEDEGPAQVTSIISPREEDGLYGIGGWEWTWSISTWDCACGLAWYYHETGPCPNCGGERPNGYELAA